MSDRFSQEYGEVLRSLREIQDNLVSQDSPGVDPATIAEQLRELAVSTPYFWFVISNGIPSASDTDM